MKLDRIRTNPARMNGQSLIEETAAEIEADNAEWDELLSTNESQNLLIQMADEAIAEHRAGQTRPMVFREDRQIIPE